MGMPVSDHLTEDLELSVDLVLAGFSVDFVPDATVEAEMPSTLSASKSQHERWEAGRIDLARSYVPALLRSATNARGRQRRARLDAAADLIVPPFSILFAAVGTMVVLSLVRRRSPNRLDRFVRVLAFCNLGALVAQVLTALAMVRAPAAVYRSLVAAPLLVGWKVVLWFGVLVRPGRAVWSRTPRNRRTATDAR
jgi:cellulose synthase/poly-beta-1,6-N-acetylglucosamine synthase-like glycosyltransferase